jgi:hypothetical protein
MKVIYIGLSDRIGPLQLTLKKNMMLLNTKQTEQFGTSNDLYSLIDDSNNRWLFKDKFHYIRRT